MATAVTSTTLTPLDRETPPRPSIQSTAEETPTASIHDLPHEPATPTSPTATQPESTTITEPDPNAFKVTILLASSGYRTQISVNRSLLEKESSVEGEGFLVSQLKNVLWKDWPSGVFTSSQLC
jgi:hypothetical protein